MLALCISNAVLFDSSSTLVRCFYSHSYWLWTLEKVKTLAKPRCLISGRMQDLGFIPNTKPTEQLGSLEEPRTRLTCAYTFSHPLPWSTQGVPISLPFRSYHVLPPLVLLIPDLHCLHKCPACLISQLPWNLLLMWLAPIMVITTTSNYICIVLCWIFCLLSL